MATGIIRVKTKVSSGKTKVKMMAKHAMESGFRKDSKTGEFFPALYLQELQVVHASKEVFAVNLGPMVSRNPYFVFTFAGGAKGEELSFTWVESSGKTATEVVKIK